MFLLPLFRVPFFVVHRNIGVLPRSPGHLLPRSPVRVRYLKFERNERSKDSPFLV